MIPRAILGIPESATFVGSPLWHIHERNLATFLSAISDMKASFSTIAAAISAAVSETFRSLESLKGVAELGGVLTAREPSAEDVAWAAAHYGRRSAEDAH